MNALNKIIETNLNPKLALMNVGLREMKKWMLIDKNSNFWYS